ncbi:MAG: GTPase ObgE [Myxococcales bacterium]|nr:GTPase ObgE [Myxococcales bacterium]
MSFVDQVRISVFGGNGGNGCVAFRREAHRPLGGPAGGDGGNGGSVILEAHTRLSTLLDFQFRREIKADDGEHGRGKDQYGRGGGDVIVQVPVGTQVFDDDTGEMLADLDKPGARLVAARGGRGGRGNIHFATPRDRAPRRAEKGEPGEARRLRLELKLMADVGIIGYPNVGKSTFIAAVSRARPEIADYPFTTLTPNLGVVYRGPERSFVVADIPGIIEGASEGAGLGLRFLRHVERTRVLLHVLAVDPDPERDPVRDFHVLNAELERFDPSLAERPMLVVLAKADLPETREIEAKVREALEAEGHRLFVMSAVTREGVDAVLEALEEKLDEIRAPEETAAEDDSTAFYKAPPPHRVGLPGDPEEQ